MKEYTVTIELAISITAVNDEQAHDRAEVIQEAITFTPPKRAKWAGNMEFANLQVDED